MYYLNWRTHKPTNQKVVSFALIKFINFLENNIPFYPKNTWYKKDYGKGVRECDAYKFNRANWRMPLATDTHAHYRRTNPSTCPQNRNNKIKLY